MKSLKDHKVIKMIPPSKKWSTGFDGKELQPCVYLIHEIDDENVMIHRELKFGELHEYRKRKKELVEYEGNYYLYGIVTTCTLQQAKIIIEGYWKAVEKCTSCR
jgi:hypothetical protein